MQPEKTGHEKAHRLLKSPHEAPTAGDLRPWKSCGYYPGVRGVIGDLEYRCPSLKATLGVSEPLSAARGPLVSRKVSVPLQVMPYPPVLPRGLASAASDGRGPTPTDNTIHL